MLTKKRPKIFVNPYHMEQRHKTWWRSSNGRETIIARLDTQHLKNIVKKINRGELESRKYAHTLVKDELLFRTLGGSKVK